MPHSRGRHALFTVLISFAVLIQLCMGLKLAAVGDYGVDTVNEDKVANMIKAWDVDAVMALGDNNYPTGGNDTIDKNIGKYYASFIHPYKGAFGPGPPSSTNRFWAVPGNHDWGASCGDNFVACDLSCVKGTLAPQLWYLPPGKAYYTQKLGGNLVELFALDSDCHQPDGTDKTSKQALWLEAALKASSATWKLVMLHHSPFSSSTSHGSIPRVQWPFEEWGAHAVFSGHDHLYERILKNQGFPYFVNGIGGQNINSFKGALEQGSEARYNAVHGAQLLTLTDTTADIAFYAATDPSSLIDCYRITKAAAGGVTYGACTPQGGGEGREYSLLTGDTAQAGTDKLVAWKYIASSTAEELEGGCSAAGQEAGCWRSSSYSDSSWVVGRTRFGYGSDWPYTSPMTDTTSGILHHWFRTSVCLTTDTLAKLNAAIAAQQLRLKVMSDNTAEVFINGRSVYKDPLADHEPTYWNTDVVENQGVYQEGTNVIAVHVTNTAGSSDAAMDLDLVYKAAAAITSPPSPVPQESLITTAITTTSFTLSWAKPACDGIGVIQIYEINLTPPRPAGNISAVQVTNPFQPTYQTVVDGLAACTTYTVTISAGNAAWLSGESSVTVKTACAPPPPTLRRFSLLTGLPARNTAAVRAPLFWRYMSTSGAIATTWNQVAFNDAAWKVGRSRFGYGPDYNWTIILPNASIALGHYFRTSFCLSAARRNWLLQPGRALQLSVFADNGADVYINGQQVLGKSKANQDALYWNNKVTVPANVLRQGTNVIAAFVSNTAKSTDAAFDLDIQYTAPAANTEVPGQVTNALATPTAAGDAAVFTWTKPQCDGSGFITKYTITNIFWPPDAAPLVRRVGNPFVSRYTLTFPGLNPCDDSSYEIRAVNAAGSSEPVLFGIKC
uniref:Fibronectin type-III domain-containing protein n=1 Tax=Tetradesmus obliquus TaxID=3088 RepID=A0A383W657_TETOB|eukprot:jgi/Sobl393_1/19671/SZX72504.1